MKRKKHGLPPYVERRYQTFYATLDVPKEVRGILGKKRFVQSLKTSDLRAAERIAMQVVGRWKEIIERAKANTDLIESAVLLRQLKEMDPLRDIDQLAFDAYTHQVQKNPGDWPVTDVISPQHGEALSVAIGDTFPLAVHIPEYDKSLTYVQGKTKDQQISDLRRFVKKFPTAQSATNRAIRDWVEIDLITEQQLAVRTCRRIMTACRGFWKFLQDRKSLDLPSPFEGVVPSDNRVRTQKQIASDQRRSFTPDDYKKLLKAAQKLDDTDLVNLIKIGAYTGCRREELCSLKINNVKKDRIQIEDAKTQAGWREVPLHDSIVDLVATMKEQSKDGYLFSGLANGNRHKKRGDAIGKRFTRLKTSLGYGSNHVFHSFRKGFVTLFESIGPEAEVVLARTIGHKITTMSYGLYSSGGTTFETKKEYINKIRWG